MERTKKNNLTLALTIVYILLMIWIILFKMSSIAEILSTPGIRRLNLIPFYYDNENSMHLSEVLANVAIFIPFGVFLRMLKCGAAKTVLAGFLLSLAFETAQYAFAIGSADITDFITNTAGTLIGVIFYGLLSRAVRDTGKLDKTLNILALIGMVVFVALFGVIFLLN